jgi:hypothetical protein
MQALAVFFACDVGWREAAHGPVEAEPKPFGYLTTSARAPMLTLVASERLHTSAPGWGVGAFDPDG